MTETSGVTAKEFVAKCKIGVGDAERLYKAATGLKGKAAAADFFAKTKDLISKKPYNPSLQKSK